MSGLFAWSLLRRDLVVFLRSPSAFWCLFITLGLAALFPIWFHPGETGVGAQGSGWYTVLFVIQVGAVTLIAVPLGASTIATERQQGTLELLSVIPTSGWQILASKWLRGVVYLLLVTVALVPIIGTLYLLGGIAFEAILRAYVITAVSAVTYTTVGLSVSSRMNDTGSALLVGLLHLLFWIALVPTLSASLRLGFASVDALFYASPMTALVAALYPLSHGDLELFSGSGLVSPFQAFLIWSAALIVLYAIPLAFWRVRADSARVDRGSTLGGWAGRRSWAAEFLQNTSGQFLGGSAAAVFCKEIADSGFSRANLRLLFFVVGLGGTLAIAACMPAAEEGLITAAAVLVGFTLILQPAFTAGTITREDERKTLSLLRVTVVSIEEVWSGKVFAGVFLGCSTWVGGWLGLVLFAFWRFAQWPEAVDIFWQLTVTAVVLVTTAFLTSAIGCWASAWSSSTTGAYVRAFSLLLVFEVLLPVLAAVPSMGFLAVPLSPVLAVITVGSLGLGGATTFGSVLGFFFYVVAWAVLYSFCSGRGVARFRRRFSQPPPVRVIERPRVAPPSIIEW